MWSDEETSPSSSIRGAMLVSFQSPISGRKSPKMRQLHVPAAHSPIFAQVHLSAQVTRQRKVQRRSPAGEARLPRGPAFERI